MAFTTSAWAGYYDVLDNAEVLPKGNYKLTGDLQFLNEGGCCNIGAKFDMGIQDQFGVRALAGTGKTDYFLGGLFKWIPVPDIENQPAVGGNIGLLYAKWRDGTETTFRFEPLVSKKFTIENAVLTPYGSVPLSLRMINSSIHENTTDLTFQLVAGAQLQIEKWKNLQFMAEVGVNLDKADGYVSVAGVFYFDEQNGFELK
jgi:hypothetical protein